MVSEPGGLGVDLKSGKTAPKCFTQVDLVPVDEPAAVSSPGLGAPGNAVPQGIGDRNGRGRGPTLTMAGRLPRSVHPLSSHLTLSMPSRWRQVEPSQWGQFG